ncbi:2'-5' RNA ligase family protein [Chitinophaga pendula]|uniref:2'-5' RNA ligase family protein n=1 Tax=Chitinophaga TaxID=79328 RepID=UPI000BAF4C2A|nr:MULTISPECIES: 2'-5' RNA ligase family protein [Chitinophaga]ASZ09521.1 RNA 2',3'-cyclic phosphodiesterase [Chitinophaga sp. MD30]UCJ07545.1 2'-5' RNA ligase family protein [Chitinophaga pendula]
MTYSPSNQPRQQMNERPYYNDPRERYRKEEPYHDRQDRHNDGSYNNDRRNAPQRNWQDHSQPDQRKRKNYGKQNNFRRNTRPDKNTERKLNKIYFIALLPNAAVGKEVIRLKQEFAQLYGPVAALKAMPHISIQVPFTAHPGLERELSLALTEFAASQQPFEVFLNGFGFQPQPDKRVIYIQVEKTPPIVNLHLQLIYFLRKEFGFSEMLARKRFTPHITLAFKDLDEDQFADAWPDYESRPFNAAFRVNNMYLLRHNGLSWEVLQKCPLGANTPH